jgi:hypothetical protein
MRQRVKFMDSKNKLDGRTPCGRCGGVEQHILGCPTLLTVAEQEAIAESLEQGQKESVQKQDRSVKNGPVLNVDTESEPLTENQGKIQEPAGDGKVWNVAEMMDEKTPQNDWFHKRFNDTTAKLQFQDQKAVFIVRQLCYAFYRQGFAHGVAAKLTDKPQKN